MSVASPTPHPHPSPSPSPFDDRAAPSRAGEALDQLIRDRQRRSLFRRRDLPLVDRAGHPGAEDGAAPPRGDVHVDRPSRAPGRSFDVRSVLGGDAARVRLPERRILLAAMVVLLVAGGVLGRHVLARPPSLDTQLPIASTEPAAVSAGSDASTGAEPAASGATASGAESASTTVAAGSSADSVLVHVAGAVAAPGVVRLPSDARVVDAVSAAGGLRADADPDRVNLAAPLVDGSRVVVPAVGQAPPAETVSVPPPADPSDASGVTGVGGATGGAGAGGAVVPAAPVDLNTATVAQLDELPGVGPTTAQAIVDHRASEGRFTSVDALLDVRGIGDAKLAALRDLVTVG